MKDISGREVQIGDLILIFKDNFTRYGVVVGEGENYTYSGIGSHESRNTYIASMSKLEEKKKRELLKRYADTTVMRLKAEDAKGNFKAGDVGYFGFGGWNDDYVECVINLGKISLKAPKSNEFVRYHFYLKYIPNIERRLEQLRSSGGYIIPRRRIYTENTETMRGINKLLSEGYYKHEYDATLDYTKLLNSGVFLSQGLQGRYEFCPVPNYISLFAQKSPLTVSGILKKDAIKLINAPSKKDILNIPTFSEMYNNGTLSVRRVITEAHL